MLSAAEKPGLPGRRLRGACAISRGAVRFCWIPVASVIVIIRRACSRITSVHVPILVLVLVLVVLASALHGAFVIWIETDLLPRFVAFAAAFFAVRTGASSGGFFEEEVEQLVGDREMGSLLELLECGEAD